MTTTTTTTTEYLLEATDISKRYGAVVALESASLRVRPGEAHALMGANGAGKSTLVKVLTGVVRPDGGTITVRGKERTVHSPAQARRGGLVSVYQEPALIPDLDISSNLRLTQTPVEPFHEWINELGLDRLDLSRMARDLPLATLLRDRGDPELRACETERAVSAVAAPKPVCNTNWLSCRRTSRSSICWLKSTVSTPTRA